MFVRASLCVPRSELSCSTEMEIDAYVAVEVEGALRSDFETEIELEI